MKLLIFGSRPDERAFFDKLSGPSELELTFTSDFLREETVEMVRGFEAIWILTNCRIDAAMAKRLSDYGVNYIVSRAAGSDHLDLIALREHGIKAANVPAYSPRAISEHTVMLLLMLLRKMKRAMHMVERQVFTLDGLRGRELGDLTVGVFGAGRIGSETIRLLHGFGCKVLVHSLEMPQDIRSMAKSVTADDLFAKSDALIFHCGLSEDTRHIVDKQSIETLKDGVLLINTARGGLFEATAVLEGLESGKIGGLAMDVYEQEGAFLRKNLSGTAIEDEIFKSLMAREDVLFTAHMSFFTDTAVANMIAVSLQNALEYAKTGMCSNELT